MKDFEDFHGELVIVRDVTGCLFEGTYAGRSEGMLPKILVTACRQINYQDATVKPLTCEWWLVGDQVFNEHHIVSIHPTNLKPR